jgi:hypothetical protein
MDGNFWIFLFYGTKMLTIQSIKMVLRKRRLGLTLIRVMPGHITVLWLSFKFGFFPLPAAKTSTSTARAQDFEKGWVTPRSFGYKALPLERDPPPGVRPFYFFHLDIVFEEKYLHFRVSGWVGYGLFLFKTWVLKNLHVYI